MFNNSYFNLNQAYNVIENYGTTISLLGSLKNTNRNMSFNRQCFCTQDNHNKMINRLYPIDKCNSCRL